MEGLIYAYHAPKSANQRAWTEQRLAELAAERAQRKSSIASSGSGSSGSGSASTSGQQRPSSLDGNNSNPNFLSAPSSKMSTLTVRPTTSTMASNSSQISLLPQKKVLRTMSEEQEYQMLQNPFELRHGRRYLRDLPYPLPCDLAEIQRQNMRTLLTITVFGAPVCSPRWQSETPKKVLELGCGSAYWSSMAHDYFAERGDKDVEFVGLDIAPLAPDLRRQGVNWKFVQHDLRRVPLPFDDGEFDLVMIKDLSLVMSFGRHSQMVFEDCVRLVKESGTIEIWDSDHVLRCLLPDTPPPPSSNPRYQEIGKETATFPVTPGQEFTPTRNKHFVKAGKWMAQALDRRGLHPQPCSRIAETLCQEDGLTGFDQRRVAIPFGKLRWEKKAEMRRISNGRDSPMSAVSWHDNTLTADQMALRQTALTTMLQLIDSMEPMLREISGKNAEEWGQWWASMMSELMDPSGAGLKGECLELGATWATKRPASN